MYILHCIHLELVCLNKEKFDADFGVSSESASTSIFNAKSIGKGGFGKVVMFELNKSAAAIKIPLKVNSTVKEEFKAEIDMIIKMSKLNYGPKYVACYEDTDGIFVAMEAMPCTFGTLLKNHEKKIRAENQKKETSAFASFEMKKYLSNLSEEKPPLQMNPFDSNDFKSKNEIGVDLFWSNPSAENLPPLDMNDFNSNNSKPESHNEKNEYLSNPSVEHKPPLSLDQFNSNDFKPEVHDIKNEYLSKESVLSPEKLKLNLSGFDSHNSISDEVPQGKLVSFEEVNYSSRDNTNNQPLKENQSPNTSKLPVQNSFIPSKPVVHYPVCQGTFHDLLPGVQFFFIYNIIIIFAGIHAEGLVHNDIKPDNIAIGNNGIEVRALDFGMLQSEDKVTSGGTLSFMHPLKLLLHAHNNENLSEEIKTIRKELEKINQKVTDLWSLTVTILALLYPNSIEEISLESLKVTSCSDYLRKILAEIKGYNIQLFKNKALHEANIKFNTILEFMTNYENVEQLPSLEEVKQLMDSLFIEYAKYIQADLDHHRCIHSTKDEESRR
jgi:serine/threonine protein kinase